MAQADSGSAGLDTEAEDRADSGLGFALTGTVRMWWVWLLTAAGIAMYVVATENRWNFPWFPALWAVVLFLYGFWRVRAYRRTELRRLQYMRDYGRKREAQRYHCNLCGATFKQPEGADLCPECYEEGIVAVEEPEGGAAAS